MVAKPTCISLTHSCCLQYAVFSTQSENAQLDKPSLVVYRSVLLNETDRDDGGTGLCVDAVFICLSYNKKDIKMQYIIYV